jgi:hypothetical protein
MEGLRAAMQCHPPVLTNVHACRVNVASPLIHDVTVTSGSSLNVVQNCRGKNLNLDMHRTAPFNNLFTNINMGAGTRPFASGGRADRGAYSGERPALVGSCLLVVACWL